jgi:hypothetical protein
MRNEEGVFIGEHRCLHWKGVDRYAEKECCGGRMLKIAYVRCVVKGVVDSAICSRSACKDDRKE